MANLADIVAMDSIYATLSFTVAAATLPFGAHGMNNIMEISLPTDVEVDALCKLVHPLGGMVPNPAARWTHIIAPGCGVSMRAITNLKLAYCFIRHQT